MIFCDVTCVSRYMLRVSRETSLFDNMALIKNIGLDEIGQVESDSIGPISSNHPF